VQCHSHPYDIRHAQYYKLLDLSQLDAEAAYLHLIVIATQILDVPIRSPSAQISGLVHPRQMGQSVRIDRHQCTGKRVEVLPSMALF
jgi:hypothetical protein